MRILSNYATERLTISKFKIPIEKLGYKGISGERIA